MDCLSYLTLGNCIAIVIHLKRLGCPTSARYEENPSGREDIRSEETVSVRNRQNPVPKTVLRQLTFVIDMMDVDNGNERLDLNSTNRNRFSSWRQHTPSGRS